jgi:hypothetical protein
MSNTRYDLIGLTRLFLLDPTIDRVSEIKGSRRDSTYAAKEKCPLWVKEDCERHSRWAIWQMKKGGP